MSDEDSVAAAPTRLHVVLQLGDTLHMATLRRFVNMADALDIVDSANILQLEDGKVRALLCAVEGEPPESLTLGE